MQAEKIWAPQLEERNEFISAMRQVANSVAVVTTDGTDGSHGATVSAFCSVSADPPTLLVCLHDMSRISRLVLANNCFCLNVLPEGLENVAERFAGKHDEEFDDRFEGIECHAGTEGCAAITGATSFQCDVMQNFVSGSHRIFMGRVRNMITAGSRPLIYLDGNYRRIALSGEAAK